MTPELNREYPQPREVEVFDQMVKLTLGQMQPIEGCLRRGQHAKAIGCVTARFRIGDSVPANLRHGVFRDAGRPFDAIVRFSNSQGTFEPDGTGTARGLAIKLLDVTGPRAVPNDADRTQDFLMVDHPIFPFPTPEAYVETMSRKNIPLIGDLFAKAHLLLLERDELAIIQDIRAKKVASPLEITYWSGAPFWLGLAGGADGHAVKYSAVPRESPTPLPSTTDLPSDYLTRALADHLRAKEAIFDFKVQLQTDAVAMPVEDASKEWSENKSPPITVATLQIGVQDVDSNGNLAARVESMAFNAWHALAEHRPMGGMNRLRKAVYHASFARRTGQ